MYYNVALGILVVLAFVSLIILFCVLFVKLHIRKVKAYTELIYNKDLDFQKTLTSTIIETQEQILNNISQDLHDDAGQQLTYINFQVENLKLDSPELARTLEPISLSVTNLSRSIRSISHSLNNQLLLQQDLVKAIKAEADRMQNNAAIDIQLNIYGEPRSFDTNEKIVLYRVFQEIINNSLKHSNANSISISLNMDPFFQMTITDNGKGFDMENQTNGTLGLASVATRVNAIDYKLEIRSAIGKGTSVVLSEKQHQNGKD